MANLNSYHLATWADSAKTRKPTGPGSSHENMWLHVRLRSMTYEVKSLIDQGNLPNYNSTQLNSRLKQRPYPATITQIHYHLTRDLDGCDYLEFLDGKSHTSVSQGGGQAAAAPPQAWACPAMAAWRLWHSDVGGVLRRRRAAAATSSGVDKRRGRRIRWRSTELRDDVEMTHQ
uniref:Uncharacterized protein n=1 Tax=Oryza glaberrima TaxID=4538 RepID=I1Q2D6_ORYGL